MDQTTVVKICICDLDDVVADPYKRRYQADAAKTAYFQQHINVGDPQEAKRIAKEAESEFYRVLFTPELVELDTLIDGVVQAIEQIEEAGYHVYFLTSRPESMREATEEWLFQQGLYTAHDNRKLIMCAPAFRNNYTKTLVWKSGMVETLTRLEEVTDLLFVDDDPKNVEAVQSADLTCKLLVASSLKDAVALL